MPGLALATAAILGAVVGALVSRNLINTRNISSRLHTPAPPVRMPLGQVHEQDNFATRTELVWTAVDEGGAGSPVGAIVVLDCDRFKLVNDAFGYGVGDLVLRQVARRIRIKAPMPHQLVRSGSDEFILLLRGPNDTTRILDLAAAIVDAFDEPLEVLDRPIYTSLSAGVAIAPLHGIRPETLLAAAEAAMREAKRVGRNTVRMYDPDVGRRELFRASSLQRIRASFDAGNLLLHYQPKLRLSDGSCEGFEALLRLRTADGLETPGPLIEAAERSGFICRLGEWIFKEVAAQVRAWRAAGIDAPIAVNLSAKQLQDPRFLAFVGAQVALDPQLPRQLQLEITESALALDQLEFTHVLERLQEFGFQIQIDDFGTGYSTLAFLSRMEIDTLKIDRTFIAELPNSKESQKIVTAIIGLAHELDLYVVAEGIETSAQAAWLSARGCDQGQGFLYGQAMAPDEAAAFVAASATRTRYWRSGRMDDVDGRDENGSLGPQYVNAYRHPSDPKLD